MTYSCGFEVHKVKVSTFYISKYEVSDKLWCAVMMGGKNYPDSYSEKTGLSWEDCNKFIEKLNDITGKKYRLPTEAEWEFAARGGNKSKNYIYSGSNQLQIDIEKNNFAEEHNISWVCPPKIVEIKLSIPNELGIYHMSDGVEEWCSDYFGSYNEVFQINPKGANTGKERVIRGGYTNEKLEDETFSSYRNTYRKSDYPYNTSMHRGLRLVLSE